MIQQGSGAARSHGVTTQRRRSMYCGDIRKGRLLDVPASANDNKTFLPFVDLAYLTAVTFVARPVDRVLGRDPEFWQLNLLEVQGCDAVGPLSTYMFSWCLKCSWKTQVPCGLRHILRTQIDKCVCVCVCQQLESLAAAARPGKVCPRLLLSKASSVARHARPSHTLQPPSTSGHAFAL